MTDTPDAAAIEQARRDAKEYVFTSWSAQDAVEQSVVTAAQGARVTLDGEKTYLDFTSQLVNVNIGYQHPRR